MYDAELLAIATGAAGTLVASGVAGGALALRERVASLLRRATAGERDAVTEIIENGSGLTASQMIEILASCLADYLVAHPDAIPEFEASARGGVSVYNQHNTGTGVFIGRDHCGDLTINHGGESR